jgi:hypothetical protein
VRPVDPLTAAVAAQRDKIAGCIIRQTEAAVRLPPLSIRFHVAQDGVVEQAELFPSDIAKTPLGECILDVALATEFGQLDKAVTFRIPVTVRRQ